MINLNSYKALKIEAKKGLLFPGNNKTFRQFSLAMFFSRKKYFSLPYMFLSCKTRNYKMVNMLAL